MKTFVHPSSIVRKIWGKSDTVLFIFAGAAAEFSLNKAVDWLYFTGKLPADPIGRLFSTVAYAKQIIFADYHHASAAIHRIKMIHTGVEENRGYAIPDWAYRDVLFMLIHYSIASFELLERKMTLDEKQEVLDVFNEVGKGMGIPNLPVHFGEWKNVHEQQLQQNLTKSDFTIDLYKQYRKHLGWFRYGILLKVQSRIAPETVTNHLGIKPSKALPIILSAYKFSRKIKIDELLKSFLLPQKYITEIKQLDVVSASHYHHKKVANP